MGLPGAVGPGQCPCMHGDVIHSPPVLLDGLGFPARWEAAGRGGRLSGWEPCTACPTLQSKFLALLLSCSSADERASLCNEDGWDGSHQSQGQARLRFPHASSPSCLMVLHHRDRW